MKDLNNGTQEKSVWDISICIGKERIKDKNGKKAHSTQKPEKLLEKIILSSTKPGDVILDPFFGSGTTGAVAKKYRRNWIGIEKEIKYINVATKRIKEINEDKNIWSELSLEVKPPKVGMKKLLDDNKLYLNEFVYNEEGILIGKITKKGFILDNKEELSIHKMSAKKLNKINNNGWNYFYVKRNEKLFSINNFRYEKEYINGRKN